jgi:hypothetical protein
MIVSCDSSFFKFNVVIFPKEYEKYANSIEENKILIID